MSDGFDGGSPFRTAFERIGGDSALSTVVEQFFDRVLADPELSRFFIDTDGDLADLRGVDAPRDIADLRGVDTPRDIADLREVDAPRRPADLRGLEDSRELGDLEASRELGERGGRGGQEHGGARVGAKEKVDLAALRRMFGQLIAGQLGAQTNYEGRNLTQAHRGLAISSGDYDRMSELFVETLWDNQVPDDIVLVAAEKLAALKPLIVEVFRPACVAG